MVLENGTVFKGEAIGAERESIGELVFTTGVVGYTEAITDEAFCGQIVVFTFPAMGNYGVNEADAEGNCALNGVVLRELCNAPSNFRMEQSLDSYLKKQSIAGICGVDTRELTKILRENGTLNAKITYSLPANIAEIKEYKTENATEKVTVTEKITVKAENEKYKVCLLDLGGKRSTVSALTKRGCTVTVVPAGTKAEDIIGSYDGVMLSSGPESDFDTAQIKALLGNIPIFAIGSGHQMLAKAAGAVIAKMPQGHRGTNQPSKELASGKTYITSQNHGYAVESISKGEVSFVNANDGSIEGISYPDSKAFSVQFLPDTEAGSYGTAFLYDRFIALMEAK